MSTSTDITSTVVLVTGTSTGFGYELVKALLSTGYKVIATSRSLDTPTMKELEALGAKPLQLDPVVPLSELRTIINDKALEFYGHIDVLINNAAYLTPGILEETSPESIHRIFSVNVYAPFNLCTALLPHLRAARQGLILNISSIAAHGGFPGTGYYCATKSAMSSLTITQRLELAPLNIEVGCVEPGYFRTSLLSKASQLDPDVELIDDYTPNVNRMWLGELSGRQNGDPVKGAKALVDKVVGKWVQGGKKAGVLGSTLIPLGNDAVDFIKQIEGNTIKEAGMWDGITTDTDI